METGDGRRNSGSVGSQSSVMTPLSSSVPTSLSAASTSNDNIMHEKIPLGSLKANFVSPRPPPARPVMTGTNKVKSRIKRTSNNGNARARKSSPGSSGINQSGFKEPVVKKKKVIEIVSPRKRKGDHMDIVKTSSDPIFIRAANQTFKFKTKTQHNRFKFSRLSLNKSNRHKGSNQQSRRTNSNSLQQGSSASTSKQRMLINSPMKAEQESEPPVFPPALISDLLWVLEVYLFVE